MSYALKAAHELTANGVRIMQTLRALERWPPGVPLGCVGPLKGKASGKLNKAQRAVMRTNGWTSSSAGWWEISDG